MLRFYYNRQITIRKKENREDTRMRNQKSPYHWEKPLAIALGGITWLCVAISSYAFTFLFAGYIG